MDDYVLASRLRALWNNLDFVGKRLERSTWQARRAEMEADSLWRGLRESLLKPIDQRKAAIQTIETTIGNPAGATSAAMKQAWKAYIDLRDKSEDILRESLEIIGTLAIRNESQDRRILQVADELIREVLLRSTGIRVEGDYYLVVHGMAETFTRARASILRLWFSEWTIWDLPLACHELGHVIVEMKLRLETDEFAVLPSFIQTQRDLLIGQDSKLNALSQKGGKSAEAAQEQAESWIHEFLADAYATYTLGPAYACSAILLRLDPASVASGPRPSDAQRAEVILGMLDWMDAKAGLGGGAYGGIITLLREKAWDTALDYVPSSTKLSPADKQSLKTLANELGDLWYNSLYAGAMYSHTEDEEHSGWTRAQTWRTHWGKEAQSPALTRLPQPQDTRGRLRDVLNAAWLCRLEFKTHPVRDRAMLEEAARDLCHLIIGRDAKTAAASVSPTTRGGDE